MNGDLLSRCSGGESLAQTGTTSFGATACGGGSQGATTLEDANHPKAGTTTLAAMQGKTEWTAAGYVYTPSSLAASPSPLEFYQNAGNNIWLQFLSTGALRIGQNGGVIAGGDTAGGFLAAATCYYLAAVGTTGNRLKVSMSPGGAVDSVFDIDVLVANADLPAAMTAINFGMLDLAAGKNLGNGFLYGWRFRNVAESVFPLTDPAATSGDEGTPYLRQMMKLRLRPNWSLLNLFVRPLHALPDNSPRTRTINEIRFTRNENRLLTERVSRYTATPSRTPDRRTVSPTRTPTRTPAVSPTRTPNR